MEINNKLMRFFSSSIEDIFERNVNNKEKADFVYNGNRIRVSYHKDEYLKISCLREEDLITLITVGDNLMDSKIIASYLEDKDDFELNTTAEWNSNPEKRIEELKKLAEEYEIINLKTYNNVVKTLKKGH